MKIFVDENIPDRTVEELRGLGHDVLDIRGTADQGMDDDTLWARVLNEGGCSSPPTKASHSIGANLTTAY